MNSASEFIKAIEDYAVAVCYYNALNRAAGKAYRRTQDSAPILSTEESEEERRQLLARHFFLTQATASASVAVDRYELELLRYLTIDNVDTIQDAMIRLRIGGGLEAAQVVADELANRYIAQSRIPEESR